MIFNTHFKEHPLSSELLEQYIHDDYISVLEHLDWLIGEYSEKYPRARFQIELWVGGVIIEINTFGLSDRRGIEAYLESFK